MTEEMAILIDQLRGTGCAVVVITPEDVLSCMDPEESGVAYEQAEEWLDRHRDEVEDMLLGDYWGDQIRDLIVFHERENAGA